MSQIIKTWNFTNPKGEKFLMKKLSNGDIDMEYLETVKKLEDYESCSDCGHIGLLHGQRNGKCCGVKGLDGYSADVCICKRKRDRSI